MKIPAIVCLGFIPMVLFAAPDLSHPPRLQPAKPFKLPAKIHWKLKNGLTVTFVEDHRSPLITSALVTAGGAAAFTAEEAGLAEAMAELLTEGTQKHSSEQLSAAAEMLGGDISASATPDAVIVETSALSDKAPEMFALMSEVIRQPNFPSAEVELRRSNMKAELDQARAESDHLALVTFDRKIFKGHPYAAAAAPTDASIARLSRELVLTAYKKIMTPVGAHLIIAGDIQKEAVEKIIADQFGTWSGAEAPADTPAVAAGIGAQRQIYLFDRPKSSQTTLIFGNLAVREDNPAFFDFLVANCILGGFSSSRLNREIREKHGYTYGIWTELDHRLNASVFHVRTSVRTEVTEPAMKAIFNELKKIRLKNPQIEEVDAAKAYLSGKMALRMETQHGIVQAIVHQKIMRLPDDFYDHYVERINAVTLPGIQRAASTFMRPDEMTVAVVGDAQKIRHALAKMSARPLTLVSSDGE